MKKELVNKTLGERKEMFKNAINSSTSQVLNRMDKHLDNVEGFQDIEEHINLHKDMYLAFKQGHCEELGFTMDQADNIIKEFGIEEIDWTRFDSKIEARKKAMIEKNLQIFEDISYDERWANDMRFCVNEEAFNEYSKYLIKHHNANKTDIKMGEFEGIGYYDYKWDTWAIRIAWEDGFYEEEIREEIEDMDRQIKVIRERKLDRQIEAYMKTLPVKKYEYTMDFKSIRNGADGIDRLENFLKEARKHAFVFHEQVSSEEWKNEKINKDYIQMGGNISDFSFVYFIEEDKQHDFEFDIIGSYKRGMEEFIGQGRTI